MAWPILSRLSKLTGIPHEENLGLAQHARDEPIALTALRTEGRVRHHHGVDVAPQALARVAQGLDDFLERSLTRHQDVHITGAALPTLRDGAEDEGQTDPGAERRQGFAQHLGKSSRFAEDGRQILVDGARPIGLVANLIPRDRADQEAGLGEQLQLPMQRPGGYAAEASHLAHVEALVRARQKK